MSNIKVIRWWSGQAVSHETCGATIYMKDKLLVQGQELELHRHDCETAVYVLAGNTWVYDETGTLIAVFAPGDMAFIPAGVWHCVKNEGNELCRFVYVRNKPYESVETWEAYQKKNHKIDEAVDQT